MPWRPFDLKEETVTTTLDPPTRPPTAEPPAEGRPAVGPAPPPTGRTARSQPGSAPRSRRRAPCPVIAPGMVPRPPVSPGETPPRPAAPAAPPAATRYPPEQQAQLLRNLWFAGGVVEAVSPGGLFNSPGCRLFLEGVAREAGVAGDPVEVMLVEELALAHNRVAEFHSRAARADGLEAIAVYTNAALRLMVEVRRTALALAEYRQRTRGGVRRPVSAAGPP